MLKLLIKMTRTILTSPLMDTTITEIYRNILSRFSSIPEYSDIISQILKELKPGPLSPKLRNLLRRFLRKLINTGITCVVDVKSQDVQLRYVQRSSRRVVVVGLVKSESRPSTWHVVTLYFRRRGPLLPISYCTCEDYTYRGFPCKHMVKLKDFYITHLNDIYKKCEFLSYIVTFRE